MGLWCFWWIKDVIHCKNDRPDLDAFTFLVEMTKAFVWPAVTLMVAAYARKAGGRPAWSFEHDLKSEAATEIRSVKP